MEPEPVVTLNNAEAMLRGQEQEEEQAILAGLSQMVWPVWSSSLFVESASAGCTEHGLALAVLIYTWHMHTEGVCLHHNLNANAQDLHTESPNKVCEEKQCRRKIALA